MTPALRDWPQRTAALGIRVLRYGSDPGGRRWPAPLLDWEQQGTGAVARHPAGKGRRTRG